MTEQERLRKASVEHRENLAKSRESSCKYYDYGRNKERIEHEGSEE